jgi:hypothetical protein
MERLFSPCNRFHDISRSLGYVISCRPQPLQELNLDVSTEELLSAEKTFTYADLYTMLGDTDTIAWLTPHATVARING